MLQWGKLNERKFPAMYAASPARCSTLPYTAALNNTTFTADELEAIDKASGFYKE